MLVVKESGVVQEQMSLFAKGCRRKVKEIWCLFKSMGWFRAETGFSFVQCQKAHVLWASCAAFKFFPFT